MILAPDGEVHGILELPCRLMIRWIGSDRLWAVETDEMDVPWLVRFRFGSASTIESVN